MAFHFSLAAVLLVRENAKKREEQALQAIQMEMARIRRQVEELSVEIASTHHAREREMQHPIPGAHLHSFLERIETIKETRKSLLERLEAMEVDRERQMNAYQAAHRDHETIVEMFNEQREAHELQQGRTEQKYIDDVFAARSQRN